MKLVCSMTFELFHSLSSSSHTYTWISFAGHKKRKNLSRFVTVQSHPLAPPKNNDGVVLLSVFITCEWLLIKSFLWNPLSFSDSLLMKTKKCINLWHVQRCLKTLYFSTKHFKVSLRILLPFGNVTLI